MTTLLLIDVQKDFHPGGSLAIPTANEDAVRLVELIKTNQSNIDRIVATMDSHHKLHIAHPGFWVDGETKTTHPPPFTIISHDDVVKKKWVPRAKLSLSLEEDLTLFEVEDVTFQVMNKDGDFSLYEYAKEYTHRLEEKGRFQLCIWPEHCLIGTDGHAIVDNVRKALDDWSVATGGSVEFVAKGQNLLTESYSALSAEVPVNETTSFDKKVMNSLLKSKELLVAGQAMSHCVNYTLRDIVENWPKERLSEITLLTDCASAVPGFEGAAEEFQKDMKEAGISLLPSSEVKLFSV
mmetsp:Transcript_802/g.1233  ORF Transcript_802/g.1233 Transcript_802/m.1233 type:complete len:294 (+) Transcript_802:47-928(+)